jgi:hypothetical protein
MSASAWAVPGPSKQRLLAKADNLTGADTLACRLLSSAAALGASTGATAAQLGSFSGTSGLAKWADVSANELATANGYTAGGATLSGVSVFYYVAAVALGAGGSGGTNGAVTLSLSGGTAGATATFGGTISGGALTAVSGVANCGNYSALPAVNAPGTTAYAVTGGSLAGATVYITWGVAFTATSPAWTASGALTAKYAVIVDTTDANVPILALIDLDTAQANVSATNAAFTVGIQAASGASPGGFFTAS